MEPQRTECAVLGLLLLAAQTVGAEQNATKGCNLPKIPLRITIWNFPPYVIVQNDSRSDPKLSGISLEFFWKLVEKCYKNCSKEVFQVNTVDSDEELIEAFETNATDIAFPITRQLKIELKDRLVHTSAGLTFQPLTVSQGYLYVVDAENQREQFLENAITSLFDDTWPMIVLILLLGGIAGSLVWLLVSSELSSFSLLNLSTFYLPPFWTCLLSTCLPSEPVYFLPVSLLNLSTFYLSPFWTCLLSTGVGWTISTRAYDSGDWATTHEAKT